GNYMPKFPQNWFVGIKTPWTISSEVVWKKTHILGGWLFALTGVVYVVFAALRLSAALPSLLILLVAASTFIYSFFLYKKLGGTGVPKGVN
ncbi:MAG TPA: SdpI family protein, partial [Candidatus Kryptobacter bacterium]|nr:SdpI family protein [Candidatus Kryptobacter bacterium]